MLKLHFRKIRTSNRGNVYEYERIVRISDSLRFSGLWVSLLSLIGWLWSWKLLGGVGFAKVLRRSDREEFDELMDMSRSFASAGGNATNPILFEPFVVSILLGQQERIRKLEKELQAIKADLTVASADQEPKQTDSTETKNAFPTATSGVEQTRFQ